jgi:hypothetical protein
MMRLSTALMTVGLIAVATTSFAGSGVGGAGGQAGGNGNRGGNGTSGGMPGCGGGTNPSSDGKFYIPGTKRECNPSDDDRKKLR